MFRENVQNCMYTCLTRVCFFSAALAARCLEVVTIHIPVFKSHFEQRLPPKQYVLLSQFDQILKVSNMAALFSGQLKRTKAG